MKALLFSFACISTLIVVVFLLAGGLEHTATTWLEANLTDPWAFAVGSGLLLLSDIFLPVPSSVIMYLNGFVLGVVRGTVLSLVALQLAATVGYYAGQLGTRWVGVAGAEALLRRYGDVAILLSRGVPVLSESICLMAGLHRYPLRRYWWLNLLGYTPLCVLYAYLGYTGQQQHAFLLALLISILLTTTFWIAGTWWRGREV